MPEARAPGASSPTKDKAEGGGEKPAEVSDLDRPVAALFDEVCSHDKKAFECDECRYEVGVVRAPASLREGGLIKTVTAEQKPVAVPLALTGEVRFDERRVSHVGNPVEGVIKRVFVALGDKVKPGQALVEIESVIVGEAQAAHLEAQGLLALARRSFERVAALKQEAIASEKEFLAAKQELEAAEIRAEGASGRLARLGMSVSEAGAIKSGSATGRLTLRAPIAGTILAMHAVSGEVARADEVRVTVGDNSSVWVWADLYERDIALVSGAQANQPLAAAVTVRAYPGQEFPGTVDLISPAMDESSRTVKVRIEVDNPNRRLLAGMFASIRLFLPGDELNIVVPRVAVLEDEGRTFVFVHHHADFFVRRPVVVGRSWSDWTEITKGLEPGQVIVAEGCFLMKSDVLRSKMGAGCAD